MFNGLDFHLSYREVQGSFPCRGSFFQSVGFYASWAGHFCWDVIQITVCVKSAQLLFTDQFDSLQNWSEFVQTGAN